MTDLKIAKGSGLSYSQCYLNDTGKVVHIQNKKLIQLDLKRQLIEVEAGMTFGDLHNILTNNNLFFPIMPGYPEITVGGGVASNCHGKNPGRDGTIKKWITEISLSTGNKIIKITNKSNSKLFNMTIGGLGLTGIIKSVHLKVIPLQGKSFFIKTFKIYSVDILLKKLEKNFYKYNLYYAWIDLNKKMLNKKKINSILFSGKFSKKKVFTKFSKKKLLPHNKIFDFYSSGLSSILNYIYFTKEVSKKKFHQSIFDALFPLHRLNWIYAPFGPKGHEEYQIIFPFENFKGVLEKIRSLISNNRIVVPLCKLSVFYGDSKFLQFDGKGIGLGISFSGPDSNLLVNFLNQICSNNAYKFYISKRRSLDPYTLNSSYPDAKRFKYYRDHFGLSNKFQSNLSYALKI